MNSTTYFENVNKEPADAACPLVSVIVPTYNRRALLEETLQSLRAQDYGNFEVLVCDDCSTDDTFAFLTKLQKGWTNLKIFRNDKNLNFNGTLARLFSLATGDFIGMQHDHDLYKPEFLSKMVELLLSNPKVGFACAAYDGFDDNGRVIRQPLAERIFFAEGPIPGPVFIQILAQECFTPVAAMSTVFRRSAIEAAGGYSPKWYLASDEDFYMRIAMNADVAFYSEPLLMMRFRPEEREKVLGSWMNIFTLFLFRISTAMQLGKNSPAARNRAIFRQVVFKWRAIVREGLSLWLRGQRDQLKEALKPSLLPPLPTNRRAIHPVERVILHAFIWPLMFTTSWGPRLRPLREALRLMRREMQIDNDQVE
jgi:glycosyltransferase involved in cell wall biosynthesis